MSETRVGKSPSIKVGVILVLMTLLGWSVVPLFLRHLSHSVDPWTNNGWRYGASALFWLPVVGLSVLRGSLPAGIWRSAMWPSIANAFGQTCFTAAHGMIDPGLVTFGLRTQMVFVAAGAYFMFPQERAIIRNKRYICGFILLAVGLLPVLLLGDSQPGTFPLAGTLLAVAAGLGYGWYALAVRRCMAGYGSVEAFAVICQISAAMLLVGMVVMGREHGTYVPSLPARELWMLGISAFIGIAIGHVFYYMSIARLGVAVTTGVLQLQPFIVSAVSYKLFGEVLSGWQWLGGSIAIVGACLMLGVQFRKTA
ncbi:MAG: DMT family transporter [Phycisphaerales bacterium]|nr:DMT family transporter [Phycisphaerales bacterium]